MKTSVVTADSQKTEPPPPPPPPQSRTHSRTQSDGQACPKKSVSRRHSRNALCPGNKKIKAATRREWNKRWIHTPPFPHSLHENPTKQARTRRGHPLFDFIHSLSIRRHRPHSKHSARTSTITLQFLLANKDIKVMMQWVQPPVSTISTRDRTKNGFATSARMLMIGILSFYGKSKNNSYRISQAGNSVFKCSPIINRRQHNQLKW